MRRVVLVNPPKSEYDLEEIAPPLGLLRLGRIAVEAEWEVSVVDFNLLWHLNDDLRREFYQTAIDLILSYEPELVGFTSMAVDSHVALEMARRLKETEPALYIVCGGTHFSSGTKYFGNEYPWIDEIVSGEGEEKFQHVLRRLAMNALPQGGGKDLITVAPPRPLYEAVSLDQYFSLNARRRVDLEQGRGCVFRCSFCYSPAHYSGARAFSFTDVLRDVNDALSRGAKYVWFVDDNLLNDPGHALGLCAALKDVGPNLEWACYATYPQLTLDVIDALGRGGCREVFCGLDAVGSTSEVSYSKAFLRGRDDLEETTKRLLEVQVQPTYAFLAAPPSHPCGVDFRATLDVALRARQAGARIVLNLLSYYSDTKLLQREPVTFARDELQAELLMDVPSVTAHNPLAQERPDLFPFHARYVDEGEWRRFLMQLHALYSILNLDDDDLRTVGVNSADSLWNLACEAAIDPRELLQIPKAQRREAQLMSLRQAS